MSYDIALVVDIDRLLATCTYEEIVASRRYGRRQDHLACVFEMDPTSNFHPAIAAAGLDSLTSLYDMDAAQAAPILRGVLTVLREKPELGRLIRGEGRWGTYDELVGVLDEFAAACEANPHAQVRVT